VRDLPHAAIRDDAARVLAHQDGPLEGRDHPGAGAGDLEQILLAVAVVGMVAIPARREGRDLLTPKGEEVVSRVRERTGSAIDAARDKVADVTLSRDDPREDPKDD